MQTAYSRAGNPRHSAPFQDGTQVDLNLLGRYLLTSRRDATGKRREFACRIMRMSPESLLLVGPSSGPVGERVIVHSDPFGKVEGRIVRPLKHGFTMSIAAGEGERERIATRLDWLRKHQNSAVADSRRFGRFVPRQSIATLTMPGGIIMSCLVIDISASGAAVSADYVPNLGMPLTLGPIQGKVVRRFSEGFAIEFNHLLGESVLEQVFNGE
jgi:hypothetical protein